MKKKMVTLGLLAAIVVSVSSVLSEKEVNASASYGTKRTVSGNKSYAYACTGSNGDTCKVVMDFFDTRAEDTANGWAQTRQLTLVGRPDTYATSNHWVNGSYIGYSQD